MNQKSRGSTKKMVGISLFTALVVILQMLGSFIRFGPFSISLVALPIVVGSAVYGAAAGMWLGLVFGVTVLISGDAAAFLVVSVIGTILTVIVKGVACGAAAGVVYDALDGVNETVAAIVAAVVCPVVNTGTFLIGCRFFFMDTLAEWAAGMGFGSNVGRYMIFGLVGGNFLVELAIDVLLCPVILRLIRYGRKDNNV